MIMPYDIKQIKARIQEMMPIVVDEFAALYGEEHRETIQQRLNATNLFIYNMPHAVKNRIFAELKEMNEQFVPLFLQEAGIDIADEQKLKQFAKKILMDYTIDFTSKQCNIDAFAEDAEKEMPLESLRIRRQCEVLHAFGVSITKENYHEMIHSEQVQALMPQIQRLYQAKKKYEQIMSDRKQERMPFQEQAEGEMEQKRQIGKRIEQEFVGEVERQYGGKNSNRLYCNGIETAGCIVGFSEENLEALQSDEVSDFQKTMIKEKQIAFLKQMGIEINFVNYEEIISTRECQSVIPSPEDVAAIEALREEYIGHYHKRMVEELPSYRETYAVYRGDEEVDCTKFVKDVESFFNSNVCFKENGKVHNSLLLSPLGMTDGYRDVAVIHELIHAIEMLIDSDGVFRCGLQNIDARENPELNEIKTQMIAMEITERLHQKGKFLIDEPETAKIRGSTSYEKNEILLQGFMRNFKKDILQVGMTGDMNGFLAKIGRENYEELRDTIKENAQISSFALISAKQSNNPNHPVLMKKEQLMRKARECVINMEEKAFERLEGPER